MIPFRTGALHRSTGIALAALGVIGLLYAGPVYRAFGARFVLWIYDLAIIAVALVAAVLSVQIWRSFSRGEASRNIWAGLALGLGLWVVGEALWSYDQLIGGNSLPDPSAADLVWVIGYIPMIYGLFLRYRSFKMRPRQPWQIAAVWSLVGLAALAGLFVIVPILASGGAGGFLEQAVNLLYPVGDLILAFQALLLVLVLAGGSLSRPWQLIATGLLCIAVSDMLYAFSVSQGLYETAPPVGVNLPTFIVNLLYAAAYIMVGLGLYRQARIQKAV